MKNFLFLLCLTLLALAFSGCGNPLLPADSQNPASGGTTPANNDITYLGLWSSNFEALSLAADSHWGGAGSGETGFSDGALSFSHTSSDFSWSGFAYSNMTDTATAGAGNQFSVYSQGALAAGNGGHADSENFVIASIPLDWANGTYDPIPQFMELSDVQAHEIQEIYITNTTNAYLSMKDGDAFAKKFGGEDGSDPDWFLLTIKGYDANDNETGTVELYLADFRFADSGSDYIIDDWTRVDLSPLGEVASLSFSLSSSDSGDWGMNTPGYFALDSINVVCPVDSEQIAAPQVYSDEIPTNTLVEFANQSGENIYVGTSTDLAASTPDSWTLTDSLLLDSPGDYKIFTTSSNSGPNAAPALSWEFKVLDEFSPAVGQAGTMAIDKDDASILAWATGYQNYIAGTDLDEQWKTPLEALGQAEGSSTDIVSLGNGGSITLTFSTAIADGDGADFAVFENSIDDSFLELGYVEVSSNGSNFVRFESFSLTAAPVSAFGSVQAVAIHGLAGKYRQGYGTPFDLAYLQHKAAVINGRVDLDNIRYVRIVDILSGDDIAPPGGVIVNDLDSLGNKIYDPFRTTGSAGFDLDAIAILNQAE